MTVWSSIRSSGRGRWEEERAWGRGEIGWGGERVVVAECRGRRRVGRAGAITVQARECVKDAGIEHRQGGRKTGRNVGSGMTGDTCPGSAHWQGTLTATQLQGRGGDGRSVN